MSVAVCGIAGTLDLSSGLPSGERLVGGMTDLLAHRGPDGAGMLVDPPVVLGHRRLAIIDLSPAGHQPMASEDGSLWITYNGEIYNYLELAEELKAHGHRFRSASDTEVLLRAYAEWGTRAFERLNGMFAFAIWDRRRRQLVCVRDRFGVKPFYYTVAGGRLLFASEIKALFLDPAVPRRPNDARVLDFLVHGLADHTPETMFEGIRQLEPGSFLVATPERGVGTPERWYQPSPAELNGTSPVEAVRERLIDSVSIRLRSDVPVGTCLSGGIDSSSVVAITSLVRHRVGAEPPDSFTARCRDPRLDEGGYVQRVLEATGARNHQVTPDEQEVVARLDFMLWHMDEPFHGPSVYGHWKVMELARRAGVTVLLDGQGGDEVFAGYHYMYPSFLYSLALGGHAVRTVRELRWRSRLHQRSARASVEEMVKLTLPSRLRGRARPPWVAAAAEVARPPFAGRPLLEQQLHGLTAAPLPAYLHHEDRNSMTFALEARVPFLDYRVVETGLALGADNLLRKGHTKWALREAMRDLVPREIVDRPDKQGFTVDHREWLRGALGRAINGALMSESAASRPYFDADGLARTLASPDAAADGANASALWRAFAVERWLELFFDDSATKAPPGPSSTPKTSIRAADNVVRLGEPRVAASA